ncbi:uncharacterized protein PHALS_08923 [Plasmopara halstedii]|uniref:Uncharacterized protein n=1 Tax=Plasmopara halstedii TaxID=4781 RepID=A0A0P1AED6_PLAHL|nr:uncharacterized protein PHALS_08923 [Plasmopara halstedii]CEG38876.1 hypothetical protein PHALS_08923 [Plasmopara halstedii]|eukprot:XP_024575245.1 hypothetical protein PHALS_08923 [Plasmopara halstedii]
MLLLSDFISRSEYFYLLSTTDFYKNRLDLTRLNSKCSSTLLTDKVTKHAAVKNSLLDYHIIPSSPRSVPRRTTSFFS